MSNKMFTLTVPVTFKKDGKDQTSFRRVGAVFENTRENGETVRATGDAVWVINPWAFAVLGGLLVVLFIGGWFWWSRRDYRKLIAEELSEVHLFHVTFLVRLPSATTHLPESG